MHAEGGYSFESHYDAANLRGDLRKCQWNSWPRRCTLYERHPYRVQPQLAHNPNAKCGANVLLLYRVPPSVEGIIMTTHTAYRYSYFGLSYFGTFLLSLLWHWLREVMTSTVVALFRRGWSCLCFMFQGCLYTRTVEDTALLLD